jgi:hypothetical protein
VQCALVAGIGDVGYSPADGGPRDAVTSDVQSDGGPRFTVTVTLSGDAGGDASVFSSPPGISCGATCSASFDEGAVVTVTASPSIGSAVAWSGDCVGNDLTCSMTISGDRKVHAEFAPVNFMFVTSVRVVPGSLGGLDGGDIECQTLAGAAQLRGRFVAWLSTDGPPAVNAASRLGSSRGWVRPDGLPVADTLDSLERATFYYPPRVDETGHDIVDLGGPRRCGDRHGRVGPLPVAGRLRERLDEHRRRLHPRDVRHDRIRLDPH